MILYPEPSTAGQCPRCGTPLGVIALRCAGWRYVLEGKCRGCGHVYLQDLPSGHGLVYPTTFDLDTGDTFSVPQSDWFAHALTQAWRRPDYAPVGFRAEGQRATGRAILLNCLDPVYGHAVLKLLNAGAKPTPSIVMVPASLEHLVPEAVPERWIVDAPHARQR